MKKRSLIEKGITKLAQMIWGTSLRKKYAKMPASPISLEEWAVQHKKISRFYPYGSPLSLHFDYDPKSPEVLEIPILRENLKGRTIGGWALDAESIHFYWAELEKRRPKVAIECGSGTSTILYASFFKHYKMDDAKLISLEQMASEKEKTEAMLKDLGLSQYVDVYHVPLTEDTEEYDMSKFQPKEPVQAEFIIVDGPRGSRMNTIPELQQYCKSGAVWYLDDALRDTEISYMKEWTKDASLGVKGIIPRGKGIGMGIYS